MTTAIKAQNFVVKFQFKNEAIVLTSKAKGVYSDFSNICLFSDLLFM